MTIELTEAERDLVVEILQARLSEFGEQVHHARVSEFSDELKRRQQMLRNVIQRLRVPVEAR